MRGNIFSLEYLLKGPEWWDIKVTRQFPIIPTEKVDETILNSPLVEPQEKHELMFKVFEALRSGETFIIHNNHNPKPGCHQLQAMYGNIFSWEYLQQGPQWWDIRVSKKDDEINK